MSTNTITIERNTNIKSASLKTIPSRALTAKSKRSDKDEFLYVVYWSRQLFGIILGIIWGIIPLNGFLGLVLYLAYFGIVYLYSLNFQAIDEESYGGTWEFIKEGFMSSFAGFLVTWFIFYTGLHG